MSGALNALLNPRPSAVGKFGTLTSDGFVVVVVFVVLVVALEVAEPPGGIAAGPVIMGLTSTPV
jgi:hypothetical protein